MAVRDVGWIQIICENGQEAFDHTICSFRIAEDNRVLLPVMVHCDGFYLTHVVEPIEFPTQEEVTNFIPSLNIHCPWIPANLFPWAASHPRLFIPRRRKRRK